MENCINIVIRNKKRSSIWNECKSAYHAFRLIILDKIESTMDVILMTVMYFIFLSLFYLIYSI